MELAVIDRIVEGEAILLVGAAQREYVVAAAQLPPTARTGTWLRVRFVGDTPVEAKVDGEETRRAEQRIRWRGCVYGDGGPGHRPRNVAMICEPKFPLKARFAKGGRQVR